jgi:tetratricopeptide (TPR) repeat protein
MSEADWRYRRTMNRTAVVCKCLLVCIVTTSGPSSLAKGQVRQEDQSLCHTYASCNQRGTTALRQGRIDEAIQLFEKQAAFGEIADIKRQSKSGNAPPAYELALAAYNNLAIAYAKKGDYLRARAWTLVALRWDKENRAAQVNLRNIDDSLKDWKWPTSAAGEYVQYAGRGTWESFVVEPFLPEKIHFCFSGLWWGLGEGPSGIGELEETVPVHDKKAEYSTKEFTNKECLISMRFYEDRLEVKQTGDEWDCGFGHNVTADGTFQRISTSAKCEDNSD